MSAASDVPLRGWTALGEPEADAGAAERFLLDDVREVLVARPRRLLEALGRRARGDLIGEFLNQCLIPRLPAGGDGHLLTGAGVALESFVEFECRCPEFPRVGEVFLRHAAALGLKLLGLCPLFRRLTAQTRLLLSGAEQLAGGGQVKQRLGLGDLAL